MVAAAATTLAPGTARALLNEPAARTLDLMTPDPLVRRAQKALYDAGLYKGEINGIKDFITEDAVRAFQSQNGVKPDGSITSDLVGRIETASQVSALLGRLERVRRESSDAALKALLSRPETRDLVGAPEREAADPTRDAGPCFRAPTVECLLGEAAESSKAIHSEDQRDWALGELLAAQAKAGLAAEARQTLRRLKDPRMVMTSLRDIAEAQAAAGRPDEAMAAAEIIPESLKKAEAYTALVEIAARRRHADDALATAQALDRELENVEAPLRRIGLHARAAAALAKVGRHGEADAHLDKARRLATDGAPAEEQGVALRTIASALAEMGRPSDALALLERVTRDEDRMPVLVAAATAQAAAGDADEALVTAATIDEGRYRAVVLARVAVAQLRAGADDAARSSLALAQKNVAEIKFPFARDYALSRIAGALSDIARAEWGAANPDSARRSFDEASEAALRITDKKLRAYTLWTLADDRRRLGDANGTRETEIRAEKATADIESRLSQVWMMSDLAAARMEAGESGPARAAFDRGLKTAEGVQNAWSRTRLLSRLAASLLLVGTEDRP